MPRIRFPANMLRVGEWKTAVHDCTSFFPKEPSILVGYSGSGRKLSGEETSELSALMGIHDDSFSFSILEAKGQEDAKNGREN